MKTLTKRICLIALTGLCSLSCLSLMAFNAKNPAVKADAAVQETALSNEGYSTPTFGEMTPEMVGPWGWNHSAAEASIIKDINYGYTVLGSWPMERNATNLAATDNLTSRSITLNGKSFYELYQEDDGYKLNSIILYVGFSVPTSALVASNGYEYPTIEIPEGTPFYEGNYLPKTTLIYKNGAWELKAEINYAPNFVAIGDLNHFDNSALNAYGLSLNYRTTGFTEPNAQVMATSWSGITLNGESQDVALWGGNQLLFWLKKEKCEAGYSGYSHATLVIEEGAKITNTKGEEFTLGAVTLYLVNGVWTTVQPADYAVIPPAALPYTGIPYGWNYRQNGAYVDTIVQFGEYGVDYFGVAADATNYALSSDPIATNLTINGVAIKDIAGATVSYAHGYNFVYISLPVYELVPNEEYKCVTLHIADRTKFKNAYLSEVSLYLINGQWTTEEPVTVRAEDDTEYFTASDMFNGENGGYFANGSYVLADAESETEILSAEKADENGTIYNFLYKSTSVDFDYSLLTYVGEQFGGVRVTIYHNEGETMQGVNVYANGRIYGTNQVAFHFDEWCAIRVATSVCDGKINVSVAVDGVEVIYTEIAYEGEIGDGMILKKAYGALTFDDYRTGDIKNPSINWQGKEYYTFTAGETKPSNEMFLQVLSATDNKDKADFDEDSFTVTWANGALQDGKLVAGEWTVTFTVHDKAGNSTSLTIPVIVKEATKIKVSFDMDGEVTVADATKGALLEQPTAPTKAGDDYASYLFDGWYFGDKKWDFANDYAFADMVLTAVFTQVYNEYTVTIVSEGLTSNYTYTLKLHFGGTLDESVFAREGYTYKLTQDGAEIDGVTVSGDMQIKVVYTATATDSGSDSSDTEKSGCGSVVCGSVMGLVSLLTASAFVCSKKSSTKEGKENA